MAFALRSALAIAVVAAIGLAAGARGAEAQCARCKAPGKVVAGKTTASAKTVRPVRNVVRYRDVRRTTTIGVVKREILVRRVIPVTNVKVVTRVHEHTVYPCPKPKCAR